MRLCFADSLLQPRCCQLAATPAHLRSTFAPRFYDTKTQVLHCTSSRASMNSGAGSSSTSFTSHCHPQITPRFFKLAAPSPGDARVFFLPALRTSIVGPSALRAPQLLWYCSAPCFVANRLFVAACCYSCCLLLLFVVAVVTVDSCLLAIV